MNRLPRILLAVAALVLLACALIGPAIAQSRSVLKLATVAPDGTPWSDGLKQLKTMVEKDTAGRVVVKPFVGGVLGDENETVVACQRGQIQGVGASTGAIASVVPELNVLELP